MSRFKVGQTVRLARYHHRDGDHGFLYRWFRARQAFRIESVWPYNGIEYEYSMSGPNGTNWHAYESMLDFDLPVRKPKPDDQRWRCVYNNFSFEVAVDKDAGPMQLMVAIGRSEATIQPSTHPSIVKASCSSDDIILLRME